MDEYALKGYYPSNILSSAIGFIGGVVVVDTVTIADIDTLRQWRGAIAQAIFPSTLPAVAFSFPRLPEGQNRRLTLEAGRLHQACGCRIAGLSMTVAITAIAGSLWVADTGVAAISAAGWLTYFILVIAAGALGKLAGLAWARRELARLAESVERAVRHGAAAGAD